MGAGGEIARLPAARLLAQPGAAVSRQACVLHLEAGRITGVQDAPPDAPGTGLLAMPAFANAHDHGRGLRSLAIGAADGPLELWVQRLGAEPRVDPYLRAAVAFARMAESGVCAANHCHNTQDGRALLREATAVARAAADTGLRIAFAVPFAGRHPLVYGDETSVLDRLGPRARQEAASRQPRTLQEGLEIVARLAELESPFFQVQYGPVGPQWVDDDTLRAIAEASARDGRRVHMHLFETRVQREWADAQYPDGLIVHLDRIGLLSERLTLAHVVWLRSDEAELLARRGVSVSLNASSNLRLRSGLPPVARLRRAGVAFGIGLDGMGLDDDEDMLREMRLLRHLANLDASDWSGEVLTPAEALRAAVQTGRHGILGEDGGGRIAPGAPGDVVLLDLDLLGADCIGDDADIDALLLTRASRRHVRSLVVGGRRVVEEGVCVSVDRPALEAALLAEARAAAIHPDRDWQDRKSAAIASFYGCSCHRVPSGAPAVVKKHRLPDGEG